MHYRDDPNMGGALRVGESLANAFDPNRVEPHLVFAYGSAGPVSSGSRATAHFVGAKSSRDLLAWPRARALIRALRPDVLHFVDPVTWLSLATAGIPAVRIFHLHTRPVPRLMQRSHKTANWIIRHLVDAQLCITHDTRDAQIALGWATPGSTFVVHNGIEIDRFSSVPGKATARRELGLPRDALLIGMVARLVWWKGGLDLLKILLRLPARWHVVFAGEGPFEETLRCFTSENGLTARTHFLGGLSDVRPVYGAMDAYAFLSRHEPFGLVLCEAMAAGVPVFGLLGDGGFSEPQYPLLTPENALLIPRAQPHDWHAEEDPLVLDRLVEELRKFGAEPNTAAMRVAAAKEWVRTRFDAQIPARKVTEIYEKLVLRRICD